MVVTVGSGASGEQCRGLRVDFLVLLGVRRFEGVTNHGPSRELIN